MVQDNIQIVLVEPSHPGNIGGVARAMKNMGLRRLTLVNPVSFPRKRLSGGPLQPSILFMRRPWFRRLMTPLPISNSWWEPVRETDEFHGRFKTLG